MEFGAEETDGAEGLFGLLVDAGPEAYVGFAEDYFERPVDREAVLAGDPLTRRTVEVLSVGADFGAVVARGPGDGLRGVGRAGGLRDRAGGGKAVKGRRGGS